MAGHGGGGHGGGWGGRGWGGRGFGGFGGWGWPTALIVQRTTVDLAALARRAPAAVLASLGYDCAGWAALTLGAKAAALGGNFTYRGPAGVLQISGASAAEIAGATAALDSYCAQHPNAVPVQTAAYTRPYLPVYPRVGPYVVAAGQASPYAQASSYTNGPTLLAAGVAAALGYAVCRWSR